MDDVQGKRSESAYSEQNRYIVRAIDHVDRRRHVGILYPNCRSRRLPSYVILGGSSTQGMQPCKISRNVLSP